MFEDLIYDPVQNVYNRRYTNYSYDSEGESNDWFYRIDNFSGVNPGNTPAQTITGHDTKNTLIVNTYIPSRDNSGMLFTSQPRSTNSIFGFHYGNGNTFPPNIVFGIQEGIGFTGNAGGSILIHDTDENTFMNYEQYTQSQRFAYNFNPFMTNLNNVFFNCTVNEYIDDPFRKVKIINYPYGDEPVLNFRIQKFSPNAFTKQTKMLLIKQ